MILVARQNLWSRQEIEKALALYCITPFGRIHSKNPEIVTLALEIGRSANSVALKMVNFASLDDSIPQKGMVNASNLDREVWSEFFSRSLDWELHRSAGQLADEAVSFVHADYAAEDVEVTSKARVGQGFFRKTVLTAYANKCAISNVSNPELLVASHIIPWADERARRLDPTNGICLNALFDRAFDRGLITFDDDFRLLASDKLTVETRQHVSPFVGRALAMPHRFLPSASHIRHHREKIFRG